MIGTHDFTHEFKATMTDPGEPDDFTVHPESPLDVEVELRKAMLIEQFKVQLERMTDAQQQAVLRVLDEQHPWDDIETAKRKMREALEVVDNDEVAGTPPRPAQ